MKQEILKHCLGDSGVVDPTQALYTIFAAIILLFVGSISFERFAGRCCTKATNDKAASSDAAGDGAEESKTDVRIDIKPKDQEINKLKLAFESGDKKSFSHDEVELLVQGASKENFEKGKTQTANENQADKNTVQ